LPLRIGRKGALLLLVALVSAGLALLARDGHLLRRAEQQTVDIRFQVRGAEPSLARGVVLVLVDDSTFNRLRDSGRPSHWPFPRRYHARVIDRLRHAGARTIALDFQFTEPTDVADDNALIEAVGRAGDVVLSTTAVAPGGGTAVLGGDRVLRRLGARPGNTSVVADSDGVIRTMRYSVNGLRSFAVVAAETASGRPVPEALFGGPDGAVPIDYAGPPGTFSAISYGRVMSGRFPPGAFAGRIAIVGASAPALQDLHATPTSGGAAMAGAEVLANQMTTVLAGVPLRPPPDATAILLVVLLALLVPLAGLRLGTLGVIVVALAVLAAWSLTAQLAFDAGTLLDYSDPVLALFLATLGTAVVSLWVERRERRRLRTLFAANSTAVVEETLRSHGGGSLAPNAVIAGYELEEPIGRGGMGVVYRATQEALGRTVALKLIASDRASSPVFRARFERESRLAAAIEHVNVIPVYEAGEDDGLLFIAMRLVEGTDLARLLAGGTALTPQRAAHLVAQLAAALDAAHARSLVHRDVKPGNVLLTRDRPQHVYLTDFGVATTVGGDGITVEGGWVGTLDYLAPEQIQGAEPGPGVDVYALAGVLHCCLTGQVPFPRESDAAKLWAHVNAPPPAPSRLQPGLPAALDAVIARGMAKDPGARFPTAGELSAACAAALGLELTSASSERSGEEGTSPWPGEPSSSGGAAAPTFVSEPPLD
jgi:serine/threonine protein kinase/CHASE2 domain-containing sensor protein